LHFCGLLFEEAEPLITCVLVFSEHQHLDLLADVKAVSHLLDEDLSFNLACLLVQLDVFVNFSVCLQASSLLLLDFSLGSFYHVLENDKAVVVYRLNFLIGQLGRFPGV